MHYLGIRSRYENLVWYSSHRKPQGA